MTTQGKKIDLYLDCVSPTSFYAFRYLEENRQALKQHGVQVEYIPVFLGGINVGSGNKPPWTLPAKGKYLAIDGKRAQRYFGLNFEIPEFFPILSLLPQRCLTYLKTKDEAKFERLMKSCFECLWLEHLDLAKPDNMRVALGKVCDDKQEVEQVLAAAQTAEVKQALNDVTKHAFEQLGAFGCPWFWVRNGRGGGGPFFGSDRFHYMWDYLEIPHRDLALEASPAKL